MKVTNAEEECADSGPPRPKSETELPSRRAETPLKTVKEVIHRREPCDKWWPKRKGDACQCRMTLPEKSAGCPMSGLAKARPPE